MAIWIMQLYKTKRWHQMAPAYIRNLLLAWVKMQELVDIRSSEKLVKTSVNVAIWNWRQQSSSPWFLCGINPHISQLDWVKSVVLLASPICCRWTCVSLLFRKQMHVSVKSPYFCRWKSPYFWLTGSVLPEENHQKPWDVPLPSGFNMASSKIMENSRNEWMFSSRTITDF